MERGIWYEEDRDRYRVRLYKNNVPYLAGYFGTYEEARAAWSDLRRKLQGIPKLRKGQRPPKKIHGSSGDELIQSAKQEKDPNIFLKQ